MINLLSVYKVTFAEKVVSSLSRINKYGINSSRIPVFSIGSGFRIKCGMTDNLNIYRDPD